jgi:putative transposase
LAAAGAEEAVAPASDYRALQAQLREMQRLLGKKTMEAEILKEALEVAAQKKNRVARALLQLGRWPMKAVCEALGVTRSNIAASLEAPIAKPKAGPGRPPAEEGELLASIPAILAEQPSYSYWRVWAMLRRKTEAQGGAPINRKRVYRVMKAHGLLLRRSPRAEERRHDGKVAVERSNLCWCSDGFELACDNGEKVRVAFALDCCDREALAQVASSEGIKGEDVRDIMVASVESRFGRLNRLPDVIEWLTGNGSGFIARETTAFARELGFEPRTTPIPNPQSKRMAEAFVRTIKRDYARVSPLPDAQTAIESLPQWMRH